MEVAPKYQKIDINLIKLDSQNPRIKQFLENYVGEPTSEQIALALSDWKIQSELTPRAMFH